MDTAPIDRLHQEHEALLGYLSARAEPSFLVSVGDQGRKVLLLSAASYLESLLTEILQRCVRARANGDELVLAFVQAKAISRQYHTYFDWNSTNANQFLGLFGPSFKDAMASAIRADAELGEAIRAFLEIGRVRNQMVHGNFVLFTLEKTAAEIFSLFEKAMRFIRELERRLCV